MLHEFCHYLTTRTASSAALRLGYGYEMAALQVRHQRCRLAWQAHIQATHAALLAAAPQSQSAQAAGTALLVCGGVVDDLPIEALLRRFQRIVLLDIAFSAKARRLARVWPGRVLCCYHDVTGVVDWLATQRRLPPNGFDTPRLPTLLEQPCWVASVNCLMQLPLLPLDWLQRCGLDKSALEGFAHQLIQAHLRWLKAWRVEVCLVTEVADSRFDRAGGLIDHNEYRSWLQACLPQAGCVSRWDWLVNPVGELPEGGWEVRCVEAWRVDWR